MAADSTAIANLALSRMGQDLIDSISGTSALEEKCNLIYTQALEELLTEGPELGWKFARRRYHGIDDDNTTVTAIAQNGTDITVSASGHALVVGDMVELAGDTGYDGTYDVTAISGTSTFDVTATFVATGTGTAHWRSEEYSYRYAMPTTHRILSVQVGGVEISDWVREGVYLLTNQESSEVDVRYIYKETTTTLFPSWFTAALVLKMAILLHYNLTQDLNAIQLLEISYERAINKAKAMDEREKYVKEYSTAWVDVGHTTDSLEIDRNSTGIGDSYGGWVYQY
jgi:hypothetical protein